MYKYLFFTFLILNLVSYHLLLKSNEEIEQLKQIALGQVAYNYFELQIGIEAALEKNETSIDWIHSFTWLDNYIYGNDQLPILYAIHDLNLKQFRFFNNMLINQFSELRSKAINGRLTEQDLMYLKELAAVLTDLNAITIEGTTIDNYVIKDNLKELLQEAEKEVIAPYLQGLNH